MPQLTRRHLLFGRFRQAAGGAVRVFHPPWSMAWSQGEEAFVAACSRCDACIHACPQHVLHRGDGGFPEMNFSHAGCTLCRSCVTACADGAFDVAAAMPWDLVVTFAASCLPNKGVECRACGEHCDGGAIRFRPRLGGAPLPELDTAACTGCGACVSVCPVSAIAPQRLAQAPSGASPVAAAPSPTPSPIPAPTETP